MMKRTVVATLFACGLAAPIGAADIYKCPTPSGKVEFRDTPCQGAVGEKLKVQSNSGVDSRSADPMAAIRAQDAEFNARRATRLKAEASADAENYRAAERAYHQERSHRANEALVEAIREGNNQRAADYYNSQYVRQPPVRVEIVNRPSRAPPKK